MNLNAKGVESVIACFQFTSNSIQLATSFEILSSWSDSQDYSLNYYWLGASTKYPSRMSRGLDSLNIPVSRFPKSISNAIEKNRFKNFRAISSIAKSTKIDDSISALKNQLRYVDSVQNFHSIEHDGISPGGALANSFVYETGRRDFDFERDEAIITLLLYSYLQVYYYVKNEIESYKINRALIYNGRFLHERASWDACQSMNIETFLFETTRNRYHLRRNQGFHDRVANQDLMKKLWQTKSLELRKEDLIEFGSRYFKELESTRNRFYQESIPGKSLRNELGYFVFYSNSDDEAVGFWESWTEPFMEQTDLIEKLQLFFESRRREHLCVRLHPNLATKSQEERLRWEKLRSREFSTVISPEEPISSYTLLKGSRGVISYGSTIGIEAAFHSKPSAILADCWYDELEVADKLTNLHDLYQWIDNIDVNFNVSKLGERREKSLIRGLWLELSGHHFENCVMREIGWGSWEVEKFKGVKIVRPKALIALSIFVNRMKRRRRGLQA
jgi:hypothetical protein